MQAIELKQNFQNLFGGSPRIYHAPGRVNLIGEHTDYNDGFVMPAAIGFSTWVAIAPRNDRIIVAYSEKFSEQVEFDLDHRGAREDRHWSDYVRGVALTLELAGHRLRGASLFIYSDVPLGSGLSSSAAIEVATGYALLDSSGLAIDRIQLAKLCQRAENDFVGIRCGIMDQFISCYGREGHVLMLDCRSLEYRYLRLPGHVRLVICNTMVKHELASSEYNVRRAECDEGRRYLAERLTGVSALRDVTLEELETHGRGLPDVIYRRCHHVISENERVVVAGAALESGDLQHFGQLMKQSHLSLRDDYEVSCAELDLMVELSARVRGVYGSRMTGGGFGGCTINLVEAEMADNFVREVSEGYRRATGLIPEIYVCTAARGAEEY